MSDTSHAQRPPTLDAVASERWRTWPHAQSPWLHEEIAQRMQARLQWIRMQPKRWLDWAPLNGGLQAHSSIAARYAQAHCQVLETSALRLARVRQQLQAPWWQRWLSSDRNHFDLTDCIPTPDRQVEMVWANMALHDAPDPQALLRQWHEWLAVDGFVMFSCLGPDTLRELKAIYQAQGWPPAGHDLTDMHDWGDMLVHAGFAEPVMDMERITLTYESPTRLLQELRLLGRNLHVSRFAGLRGKQWLKQLTHALMQLAQPAPEGRLSLSVEVIYGHALKPVPKFKVAPESTVSLAAMRATLSQSKTTDLSAERG